MSSSFIPMDTPDQPQADPAAPGPAQVGPPTGANGRVDGKPDPGAATTAKLRAGLASRLRSAYERGAGIDRLAAASHQSVSEVRELLQLAGVDPVAEPPVPAPETVLPSPRTILEAAPGAFEEPADRGDPAARPRPRIRRPAPARRLSRTEPEPPAVPGSPAVPAQPEEPAQTDHSDGRALPERAPAPGQGDVRREGPEEPALGILIGGAQRAVEPPSRPSDPRFRRVAAQLIRVGRGTTLAVLPAWRSSIAISVPTELLLDVTGLSFEELAEAELTVVVNPDALHDRELRAHDWQVGPATEHPRRRRP
ncbi:hypothetical protein ACIGXM_35535 [Kitasatospora sp. NPDC052896]|uniref:hypothetical protein n=1 Tax=Kitasatospora sp. NPDC052896 TaxID=3364061 RepID=UPI0037C74B6F